MQTRVQIISIAFAGLLLLGVLEMVRRRRLRERYALLWLAVGLALLVLAAWKDLLVSVSKAVGIYYPPSALFVVAFGCVLLLLLHFSAVVSKLADQTRVLAQRLALLEQRVDAVDASGEAMHAHSAGQADRSRSERRGREHSPDARPDAPVGTGRTDQVAEQSGRR